MIPQTVEQSGYGVGVIEAVEVAEAHNASLIELVGALRPWRHDVKGDDDVCLG